MRALLLKLCCVFFLTFSLASPSALAQATNVKKSTETTAPTTVAPPSRNVTKPKQPLRDVVGQKGSVAVPLTEAECKGLGGKVVDTEAGTCAGVAKACYTTDRDGVIRSACITAK